MGLTLNSRRMAWGALVSLILAACILGGIIQVGRTVHADERPQPNRIVRLGEAHTGALYALTFAVKDPAQIQGNDAFRVIVSDPQGEIGSKWIHAGDLDLYLTIR